MFDFEDFLKKFSNYPPDIGRNLKVPSIILLGSGRSPGIPSAVPPGIPTGVLLRIGEKVLLEIILGILLGMFSEIHRKLCFENIQKS